MKAKKERSCPGKGSSSVRSNRKLRRFDDSVRSDVVQLIFTFMDREKEREEQGKGMATKNSSEPPGSLS
jgi:hypothetical protein